MTKIFLAAVLLVTTSAFGDDEHDQAVKDVQSSLRHNPELLREASASPESASVDQHVKGLSGGGQNEKEIYDLSADILGNMKDATPEEMMKMLEEAQRNPAAFAEKWTPEQRARLKEISNRLPMSQQKQNP